MLSFAASYRAQGVEVSLLTVWKCYVPVLSSVEAYTSSGIASALLFSWHFEPL